MKTDKPNLYVLAVLDNNVQVTLQTHNIENKDVETIYTVKVEKALPTQDPMSLISEKEFDNAELALLSFRATVSALAIN